MSIKRKPLPRYQAWKKTPFSSSILRWFGQNKRDFPWRNRTDVYAILVAEVLLRKTDAKRVIPVYNQLLRKYPGFRDLATADGRSLTKMLTPLGIYRTRPIQLRTIASIFLERFKGKLPDEPETLLLNLQGLGVGRYIVNAVFCLAEGNDLPMLDANGIRILQRVFGLITANRRPRDDPRFWDFLATLIPRGKGRDLNLGLIDFGALVCTAFNPKCGVCPMNTICAYYESVSPR